MTADVLSWKQEGVISLWRYTEFPKKFGGWHLSGTDAGVASLKALLRLLVAAPGIHRTISVTPPSPAVLRVPNFQQGDAKWVAPSKWQISCTPSSNPRDWEFPPELEPAKLVIGESHLSRFISALDGIPKGEGDFCIGSPNKVDLPLCFWWWPRAT